jgi:glyoxylase-like metal-dependent hydrolase (beta-lactamase superfamily II)
VLFLESRRVLLTGDTLVTHNPLTGRTGPQIMPSGLNRDTLQTLDSLSALEHLTAEIILPGHGGPWHGPISQAVQLARAAGPS